MPLSTWILVSNASEASLYNSNNLRTSDLNLVKQLTHPQSRMKGSDLTTDAEGSYSLDTGTHGAYEGKHSPKKVEAENFAMTLAKEIYGVCNNNGKCEKLIIVAPAHFCGYMKKHLNVHVNDLVYIAKDYTKYAQRELLEILRKHLF